MMVSFVGAVVRLPVQVVPQRIESVNGFDVNMGRTYSTSILCDST